MAEQNAYTILNLRKGANDHEIKLAYVEQVKRYDPEKHTERFMVIQKAYERLRDPKKRAHEDVFTYNYVKGEFTWSDEEKVEEPLPDLQARIKGLEQHLTAGTPNPAIKPALIANHLRMSFYHTQKKLWTEAINDWVAVLQLDSTHQRAKSNLIFSYQYLGYYYALHDLNDEAIKLWENALQMDPGSTDIIHNLALTSEKAGDRERAQRYWGELVKRWKEDLEKNPGDEYLRNCLMEVHKHHGAKALESVQTEETKEQAIESYKEVLKINPSDFEAQYSLACAMIEEKKYDDAVQAFIKLQNQHPKNLDVVNQLGWAYLNAGKFEMAFNTWRRGLIADPKAHMLKDSMMRARLAVGKKLKEGGHYTQALVHFKELQKMLPNQWEIHFEIADTLLRKGDRRNALTEFQKVLELDPKNKLAKKAISDIRMRA
ncbi:MAG: tetratricopeptide repeat protein [Candidatus Sumerlaeaceae bacterium]